MLTLTLNEIAQALINEYWRIANAYNDAALDDEEKYSGYEIDVCNDCREQLIGMEKAAQTLGVRLYKSYTADRYICRVYAETPSVIFKRDV